MGPISVADDDVSQTSANTLMYSKDAGLYSLQDRGNARTKSMVLVNLDVQLKAINSVLSTWAKVDSSLTECCASTPNEGSTGACKGVTMPITGLVGFLSNDAVDSAWKDKYLSVDAIVENGKKAPNGFEFAGHNSGSVWPVISFDQSGEYRFANYAFSLVATVAIHTTPTGITPLMGGSLNSPKWPKLIGVSYTADKRWVTVFNDTVKTTSVVLELGKEYKVAVTRKDNAGSVYVDGDLVGHSDRLSTYEPESAEISDFYVGNVNEDQDADTKMNITVTNVFLYNRALSSEELGNPCTGYVPIPNRDVSTAPNNNSPPNDTQTPASNGTDITDGPGIVPPTVPGNGTGLNNTVQQPGSQETKPSGTNPRPPNSSTNTDMHRNNGIGDGAVPACISWRAVPDAPWTVWIWDFVLSHPM